MVKVYFINILSADTFSVEVNKTDTVLNVKNKIVEGGQSKYGGGVGSWINDISQIHITDHRVFKKHNSKADISSMEFPDDNVLIEDYFAKLEPKQHPLFYIEDIPGYKAGIRGIIDGAKKDYQKISEAEFAVRHGSEGGGRRRRRRTKRRRTKRKVSKKRSRRTRRRR